MLSQAETAIHSARQLDNPAKPYFALGFMIGHESTWVPEALGLLRDELPNIHVVISSQNSPQLATALSQGRLDVAFLRREDGSPDLDFSLLVKEPLEVFLPKDHALAAQKDIRIQQIVGETFLSVSGSALSVSGKAPALRLTIDRYLEESGIHIRPSHEVDNLGGVMSLIASTGGVALLPAYAKTFLPNTVTSRPLHGFTPTIDLSVGYRKGSFSPILTLFLSRLDKLKVKLANKT
jgi:LysR family transcriptional regulator, hca operon transcriptional activator